MLGGAIYWCGLAAGAVWATWGPLRWREAGLALLAISLTLAYDVRAGLVYACLGVLTWRIVRAGRPPERASAAVITALAVGFVLCESAKAWTDGRWQAPLGLSYLVFRLIHAVLDARRGTWARPPDLWEFGHFLFSPALFVAGPLERWGHWIKRPDEPAGRRVAEGVWRIMIGFFKKLYLADLILPDLAVLSGWTSADMLAASDGAGAIWQASLLTYLKIYIEFSGYSDIAVGAALLWGRRPMENFNWPILASTPQDYWRRWHISIAQWCAECVYMPLLARWRRVAPAMFGSFLVMGLWHWLGWNRVAWAAWQLAGVLAAIHWQRRLGRPAQGSFRASWPWRLACIAGTQAFVLVGYAFLMRGENVAVVDSLALIARMFGWPG